MLVDSSITTVQQIRESHEFAIVLLEEALSNFFDGDFDVTRIILRDIVNGTLGFEELEKATNIPIENLQEMLSPNGNPTVKNFCTINTAIAQWLGVDLVVQALKSPKPEVEDLQTA